MKILYILAVLAAALLAGCSKDSNTTTTDTTPQPPGSTAQGNGGGPPVGITSNTPSTPATAANPASNGKEVTTKSGLKYVDEKVGTGPSPKTGQTVVVTYVGKLTNGEEFDASAKHGGKFEFVLGQHQVIAGWDEGVATMKKGGKRTLTVPSNLGYGLNGQGTIPPNSTLIFDIELLDIK